MAAGTSFDAKVSGPDKKTDLAASRSMPAQFACPCQFGDYDKARIANGWCDRRP